MPANTPVLALPYPVPDDNVDVPRDVKALADKLDTLTALTSPATTKVAEVTLASAASGIDFPSIPAIYANLLLVAHLNTNAGSTFTNLLAQFNGDATASYSAQTLYTTGGGPSHFEAVNTTAQLIGTIPGGPTTFQQGMAVLFLPNYTQTAVAHPSLSLSAAQGTNAAWMRTDLMSGIWNKQQAINRVLLLGDPGISFQVGNRAVLYGLR